ncbi:adhesion G protein-coupled receptor E5-like [Trachemys scripta elegans]|uniref:adhesion G protein-coupled receptor E5-like n=1 Tax=Trachemys scripta elegans TaxID=31138 RepID=UPI001555A8A3|nr:adhesion G protein-coupled receptor E5-like [Trachemys scripta elegans]
MDSWKPSGAEPDYIDECQRNTTICESHGNCINMPGSYMCKCSVGFGKSQKDTSKICTDIDECRKTPDICNPNATCINTYGSYRCKCRAGYVPSSGNTTLCQELTCPLLLVDDNSAEAKNLLGSFQAQVGRLCKAALKQLKQMETQSAEPVKGQLQGFLDILKKQINLVGQQSESVERRHRIATELMATVEMLLRTLAPTLRDSMISIASTNGRGFTLAGLLTYQGMSPILEGAGRVEAPEFDKIG